MIKENIVKGIIASTGSVQGRVRIMTNLEKIKDFLDGEILVAEYTNPSYVRAMIKAAAVVTDSGGVTSHAAIISRELGIPCIVGTRNATKVLKDGDVVEVEADSGMVKILN